MYSCHSLILPHFAFMLMYGRNQHNIVKQLSSNKKKLKDAYYMYMEKEMATHYSTLAWRIPWTEEPSRLQSVGLQELDTT